MNERFASEKLFPVLRAGLSLPADDFPALADEDFRELAAAGKKQSLLPLIREGLLRHGVTGEGYDRIDRLCLSDLYQFAQRNLALNAVCGCLEAGAIPYVPLKGSVIRDYYPEPWMRTSSDLDILIRESDLDRACALLEEKTDFRKEGRDYHDVLLKSETVLLELHFSLLETMESLDAVLRRVWDYCAPVEGTVRYAMSAEFQIFHTIAHMTYHLTHGGLGIRPYLDLWLLRHHTAYDEDEVRALCKTAGILTYYDTAVRLSEVWLAGAEHTPVTRALEQIALDSRVFGSSQSVAAMGVRERGRFRFLLHRAFPPVSTLAEQYPVLKEKRYLAPLYYVRRFGKGFRKKKQMTAELNAIMTTDPGDIRSVDDLLLQLGL